MKWYEGKEICQGCRKPGTEVARHTKEDLCKSCKELLAKGKAVQKIEDLGGVTIIKDWFHGLTPLRRNSLSSEQFLDSFVTKVFEAGDLGEAESRSIQDFVTSRDNFKRSQYLGAKFYALPTILYEPFKEIALQLDDALNDLNKRFKEAEEHARQAVAAEKDRIYNEGVAKGRQLLMGLQRGEILMQDFEKQLKYNK